MGCHTWLLVPFITDKKEVLTLAQNHLNKLWKYSESYCQMYQYAIDNELEDPVCDLAMHETDCVHRVGWVFYMNVFNIVDTDLYTNQPRITGYPPNIIKSYDEMLDFTSKGYIDEEGTHHSFHYSDNKEIVNAKLKKFFEDYPEGIITFG